MRDVLVIEMEDPDIIPDPHVHNSEQELNFNYLAMLGNEILNEDVGTAVGDRRHDSVLHLVKVVSVHDLWEQIVAKLLYRRYPYSQSAKISQATVGHDKRVCAALHAINRSQ